MTSSLCAWNWCGAFRVMFSGYKSRKKTAVAALSLLCILLVAFVSVVQAVHVHTDNSKLPATSVRSAPWPTPELLVAQSTGQSRYSSAPHRLYLQKRPAILLALSPLFAFVLLPQSRDLRQKNRRVFQPHSSTLALSLGGNLCWLLTRGRSMRLL